MIGESQSNSESFSAKSHFVGSLPAVSYAEVRDFGPFDTIVYVGGLYVGKTTGLAKTARRPDINATYQGRLHQTNALGTTSPLL